jgi:predicted transcriptional regulator of viral defense system
MNYTEFREEMKSFPVFSIREIEKRFPGFDTRRLVEWQSKGYIQRLRNRYYCFSRQEIDERLLYNIANALYRPSYVSLETALARYGFIPEGVFQIVSCTTLKTQTFSTPLGTFIYRHVKPGLFFGYRLEPWQVHHSTIAEPEKALIDYLYLHPEIQDVNDFVSLRWNRMAIKEQIEREKLAAYERHISSPALSRRLRVFRKFLYAESK